MVYSIGLDMGIAERAILAAIKDLQSGQNFNYEDIAKAVPCSEVTVWRYMPKLIKSGKVKRIGIKHTKACRYEVVDNA